MNRDTAMNGEAGAAQQATLGDISGQVLEHVAAVMSLRTELEALKAAYQARQTELLAANNAEVERRRHAERWNHVFNSAVRWALGEGDEFRERGPDDGPYWWRIELRYRASAPTVGPLSEVPQ